MFPTGESFALRHEDDDAFLIGRDCQMHFAVYCREDGNGMARREEENYTLHNL